MKCPFCLALDTKVVDSRSCREGLAIKRRRKCPECDQRFTTFEQVGVPITVLKRDGTKSSFDRDKVASGILKACSKKTIQPEELEQILARIEAEVGRCRSSEIPAVRIGELVMNELKAFDRVAYIRFASVYRDFKDVNDFQAEIEPMLEPIVK